MIDKLADAFSSLDTDREQSRQILEKLFAAAQPRAVFGEPVVSGDYTVIPACEVMAGGGFGMGRGFGSAPGQTANEPGSQSPEQQQMGGGGGGGGGGGSSARPVAVIEIGPNGVNVKPILDVSKIALAGIAAAGAIAAVYGRILRASRA